MSLLLVNPNRETRPVPAMPIGLLRVAEAAEQSGEEVRFLDLTFGGSPQRALRRELARDTPTLIGFGVRNIDNADASAPRFYLDDIRPLVATAREAGVPVVIGGAGASVAPDAVRDDLGADCVVVGPGEAVIADLVRKAREGGLPARVEAAEGTSCAPAADYRRWLDLPAWRRRAAPIPIQSRRGCPRQCVYCNYAAIEGATRYELGAVDRVVEEIAAQVRATGCRHFEFVDSTFNSPPQYTVALCEALTRSGLGLDLGASGVTPRHGTRDVLRAMRDAGFRAIWCSPDTATPETLRAYGKGFTVDQLVEMVDAARDLELTVLWSFLFGGPGETDATIHETLRFVREVIPPEHPVMVTTRMRIYPGTRLARTAAAEGMAPPVLDPRAPGQFYLSPGLDGAALDAALDAAHATLPNVMVLSGAQAPIVGWLQRLHGLMGWNRPTWADYAPIRRRVMSLTGRG